MTFKNIRKDFPILDQEVNDSQLIYLDNAATTQKPRQVLDTIRDYYDHDNANIHRGVHALADRATQSYEDARRKVQRFISAEHAEEVIFTSGTTHAMNMAIRMIEPRIEEGDDLYISPMDHHSVIVPMQELAKRTGANLHYLPLTEDGFIDLEATEEVLTDCVKLVTTCHASNVLGVVNDVKKLGQLVHERGGYIIVDGAQSIPHMAVDVVDLDVDFYGFSGHKMLGPTGIGVLYGKRALLKALDPVFFGGEMIGLVGDKESTWADLPYKFEPGTPNIAGAIGLGAAIDYLTNLGMDQVEAYEQELVAYALPKLQAMEGIIVHGPQDPAKHSGVLSFAVDGVHPHDLATGLDLEGIAVRAGHHCAQPLMRWLKEPATARASFYIYNTKEEVDAFIQSLAAVKEFFTDGFI